MGEVFGSKELKLHIKGVKEKALYHFSENLGFEYSDEELKELLSIIVDFHDLGKYTTFFQNYILQNEPIDHLLKQHAQIGGYVAYNSLNSKDEKQALLALYVIFLHHSQLISFQELNQKFNNHSEKIINRQISDLKNNISVIEKELQLDDLKSLLIYSEERKLRRGFKHWSKKYSSIQDYFLINYLFSLLIEGDKLDASDTIVYKLKSIKPSSVDDRFGKPDFQQKNLSELDNNELRNFCRAVVISNLEQPNILEHFIFTLTAPTGIGKTMTALDFTLKLKDKIKYELGIDSRVIYGLPFINIIEQSLSEYQKTLENQNVKILGHYQYANVFGDKDEGLNDDGAEKNYHQKIMELDTWQADIVITSFVQFFETLISNRNKLLKKFNHFANAIIVLDEVQTLRLDQMPLIGAALFYLSKYLKSRIILMTATRPKIFELAEKEILNNIKIKPRELLTNFEDVFAVFKRTAIFPLLEYLEADKEERTQEFINTIFSKKWSNAKSCLLVCNTVNRSIDLYDEIINFLADKQLKNPVYYLSTNIIPADRMGKIEAIRVDIENNKAPILVATQVVEAGVDLDFDMGFRDIGPIDSIIQVAGRINRNNDQNRLLSPLYIVDFDKKTTEFIYGKLTYIQAYKALKKQQKFDEPEYLKLVNEYFDGIASTSSFSSARKYFESMQSLRYTSDIKEEFPVGNFRIIEQSDKYNAVFVEKDEEATKIKEMYLLKILNEIDKEEFDKNWKLKFQQHIISIPKYLTDDLDKINEYEDNILVVSKEDLSKRYNLKTGFNRKPESSNTTFVF